MNFKLNFDEYIWNNTSNNAKDLIKNLLTFDVGKRFSTQQILKHKFISTQSYDTLSLN